MKKQSEFSYKKIGKEEKERIIKSAKENEALKNYILEVGKKITSTEDLENLNSLYTTRLETCKHERMIPIYEFYIAACAAIYKALS